MTTPGVQALPQYTLKHGPYSSHSLLLRQLPAGWPGPPRAGCRVRLRLSLRYPGRPRISGHRDRSLRHRPPPGTEFIDADLDDGLPPLSRLVRLHCLRRRSRASARSAPHAAAIATRASRPAAPSSSRCRTAAIGTSAGTCCWAGFRSTTAAFSTARISISIPGTAGSNCSIDADFEIEAADSAAVPIGLALPRWEGSLAVRAMERLSYLAARHLEAPVRVPVHRPRTRGRRQ